MEINIGLIEEVRELTRTAKEKDIKEFMDVPEYKAWYEDLIYQIKIKAEKGFNHHIHSVMPSRKGQILLETLLKYHGFTLKKISSLSDNIDIIW